MKRLFTLRIELGNEAMETPEDVALALTRVREKLLSGGECGKIHDLNGNCVGSFGGDFEYPEDDD